mgnify:FL=1|jgi:hypothetical protein
MPLCSVPDKRECRLVVWKALPMNIAKHAEISARVSGNCERAQDLTRDDAPAVKLPLAQSSSYTLLPHKSRAAVLVRAPELSLMMLAPDGRV